MSGAKVTFDPDGLNKALSQQGMRYELNRVVQSISATAKRTAPFETGEYTEGIHAEVVDGWVRPRGKVYADAPHSMAVESNTGNLARALGAEGG